MPALLRSPNRVVALALGAAYAGYGIFSALTGRPLLGVLLGIAAAALAVSALLGIAPARRANIVAGTVWLILGYAGLFIVGTAFNILGLTALDEVMLFAAATAHLAVGLGARRDIAPDARTPSSARDGL